MQAPVVLPNLMDAIVEALDIPKSLYEKAAARHKSVGEWFCRPQSRLTAFDPQVSLQGSFRYGTVNRPLLEGERYDLDNVTRLNLSKARMTQKQLKELHGLEVKDYAKAHSMLEPVEEKNRCWRLNYTDEVEFHLDTLPCVPEEAHLVNGLIQRGVPADLAQLSIAITDIRHPGYQQLTHAWPSSNPRGFALWFEQRLRPVAEARIRRLVESRVYASVDDVPPYEWKTPLQRAIQILKRHRDVMFREHPDLAPISMIITNLAAHAYRGEPDVWSALDGIVSRMGQYVSREAPRVPNPADPAEDYADRWARNPALERNFWAWHEQVRLDLARLVSEVDANAVEKEVRRLFNVTVSRSALSGALAGAPAIVTTPAPFVQIGTAPRPWSARR
jgi:hypothetical protein